MKVFLLATLFILSQNVLAAFNEVECYSKSSHQEVRFEIEQPFPNNSAFRNGTLTVIENGNEVQYDYHLTKRFSQNTQYIKYWGSGVNLEINLWPDQRPTWGRNYRSTLSSPDVSNSFQTVTCNFPNIF